MLVPNIPYHALLRLREALLRNRTVRIADGTSCPTCGTVIRTTDPETTNDGWRIVCSGCHRDLLIEESR